MSKLQTTIAQGRRRQQLDTNRIYKWQPEDISIRVEASTGGLTIIMPKMPKMKDVTPNIKRLDKSN